ncbi:PRC-barrel domain protein precursor (fragment) [Bradyrhizobium sp. STM 3843]|uniref:PRC-barrel domain protein precursor (fragment) n=1 Tax=Bradyrhizobium sp. STM 3843 TaxID=551947 RepID=UPI0002404D0B
MRNVLVTACAIAALAVAAPAFAQGTGQPSTQGTGQATTGAQSSAQQSGQSATQKLAAAQQIQQDLKNAGFTDVKVVAESFVVQAKTKDGNPILMTIGPHGMSMFEAEQTTGSNSGSASHATTGSSSAAQTPSK